MNLEQYISQLNRLMFWREFTFSQNKFAPSPGAQFELADNFVWLGDHAYVLQLKERTNETEDAFVEETWFKKKVLDKGTKQIRDTLRFLTEHKEIKLTNERGHSFDISGADLQAITKIVVFLGGKALPEACRRARCHVSTTAGFIHVLAAHDYLGILKTLRVPGDVRRYFAYREEVVPKLGTDAGGVEESDIMGAFLAEEDIPTIKSRERLRQFIQDVASFDLSPILEDLHDHIERSDEPYGYYRIMLEFARVPRSMWREIKARFIKSMEIVRKPEFALPFRLAFPETSCAFMIAPLDPELSVPGPEGEKRRMNGLEMFTHAAKYDAKMSKGIGILISKIGAYIHIDWCLLDAPWKPDPEMDKMLAENYPFRQAREKMIDSFLFVSDGDN